MPRTVTLFVHNVPESVSAREVAEHVQGTLDDQAKDDPFYPGDAAGVRVTYLPPRERVGG